MRLELNVKLMQLRKKDALEVVPGGSRFAGDMGLELASCLLMSDL